MKYESIEQVNSYKGYKVYRQTQSWINGYGKPVTHYWYYAVKDNKYFTGKLKEVKDFISSGIAPSEITEGVSTALNPTSSIYS